MNAPSGVVSYWYPSLRIQLRSSNSFSVRRIVDDETPVISHSSDRLRGRTVSATSVGARCWDRERYAMSSIGDPLLLDPMISILVVS
jgi:hypothetical protein